MSRLPSASRPQRVRTPSWREELLETIHEHRLSRRRFLGQAAIGVCGMSGGLAATESYAEQAAADQASKAVIGPREPLKITKLETLIEEPAQSQNIDILAELAAKTHIPVATGERIYTKWGFREVLDKKAARILQPDICYAGGITELRLIARHGRGALRAAGAAQPARPLLAGGQLSDRGRDTQLSDPGTGDALARQSAQDSVSSRRRLLAGSGRTGAGH